MIEVILLVFLLAKLKKLRISCFFTKPVFYPILLCELIHLVFQITIFCGNYTFVPYAAIIKRTYMFLMLIPLFAYKQVKTALWGSACVFLGTFLNQFVMSQNGGKMPVFPTLSLLTGYVKADTFVGLTDIHVLGTQASHYIFLCDIFDLGYTILSLGDIFIHMFVFLTLYGTIKHFNSTGPERKTEHHVKNQSV